MAKTKYFIHLSAEEHDILTRIVCEAKESERTIMRAKILLMSETAQSEKMSIKKLAELLGTTDTTIQTVGNKAELHDSACSDPGTGKDRTGQRTGWQVPNGSCSDSDTENDPGRVPNGCKICKEQGQ